MNYKFYTTVGIMSFKLSDYDDISNYVLHREDGPAAIAYYHDGSLMYEEWYWCGMIHRHDYTQPSVKYSYDEYEYYWYGVECDPKDLLDKDFRDRIQLEQLG